MDEFISNKDFKVTSIVLDPSGLILRIRNSAREFTGSVTWTIYGTPNSANTPITSSEIISSESITVSSDTATIETLSETEESSPPGFISAPFYVLTFTTVFLVLYSVNKVIRKQ